MVNERFRITRIIKKNFIQPTNGNGIITTSITTVMIDENGLSVTLYSRHQKPENVGNTICGNNFWGSATTFSSDDYHRILHICNE
jgi:hypothetical protein